MFVSVVVGRWRFCWGTRQVKLTLYTFRDGQKNAGDEGFTVVGLLEDSGPLSKTRSGSVSAMCLVCCCPVNLEWDGMGQARQQGGHPRVRGEAVDNLRSRLLVREGRELNLLDAHTDRMEFRYLAFK